MYNFSLHSSCPVNVSNNAVLGCLAKNLAGPRRSGALAVLSNSEPIATTTDKYSTHPHSNTHYDHPRKRHGHRNCPSFGYSQRSPPSRSRIPQQPPCQWSGSKTESPVRQLEGRNASHLTIRLLTFNHGLGSMFPRSILRRPSLRTSKTGKPSQRKSATPAPTQASSISPVTTYRNKLAKESSMLQNALPKNCLALRKKLFMSRTTNISAVMSQVTSRT